ncbi:hypothetical protein Taro_049930, partial [Colocasia esculenta]|nr:hypothetical protein [Colocasia esculenta]
ASPVIRSRRPFSPETLDTSFPLPIRETQKPSTPSPSPAAPPLASPQQLLVPLCWRSPRRFRTCRRTPLLPGAASPTSPIAQQSSPLHSKQRSRQYRWRRQYTPKVPTRGLNGSAFRARTASQLTVPAGRLHGLKSAGCRGLWAAPTSSCQHSFQELWHTVSSRDFNQLLCCGLQPYRQPNRPRICILGGGFGGLYTALRLESLVWTDDKKPQIL